MTRTMQRSLIVLLVAMLLGQASMHAQRDPLRADDEAGKALDFMDRNLPESAIQAWDKALALMPDYRPYIYEKAVCLTMTKRFDDAIALLTPIYTDTSLKDRGYQLLGACYDERQDTSSSRRIYREGLAAYPTSGRLHFEMGQQYYVALDRTVAHQWWARGTQADPTYAKNYYWLAKSFAQTKDILWAMQYAELFLNLERNTQRTAEMSQLCFELWNKALKIGDANDPINFCSDELLEQPDPRGQNVMSFPVAFEYQMALAASVVTPKDTVTRRLSIEQMVDLRYAFTRAWIKAGLDTLHRNDLLTWNVELQRQGKLKDYLWWLYAYGDKTEMNRFFRKNEQRYDTFLVWFGENGMVFRKPLCVGYRCP